MQVGRQDCECACLESLSRGPRTFLDWLCFPRMRTRIAAYAAVGGAGFGAVLNRGIAFREGRFLFAAFAARLAQNRYDPGLPPPLTGGHLLRCRTRLIPGFSYVSLQATRGRSYAAL